MNLRIKVSRHAAFYSPLISTIAAGFLERQGLSAEYSVLAVGQRSSELIRQGAVDIMQSAVSSNWKPMEEGESPLPVHFAQINQRDGFFLLARVPEPDFQWKRLEGRSLVADHGAQPLAMLRYAVRVNGADWKRIEAINRGSPEEMQRAFREGTGDFIHLQAPASQLLEWEGAAHIVASVGAAMPPVAFSSLCCSREFLRSGACRAFREAFRSAREWVRSAPAAEVAQKQASFFPAVPPQVLADAITRYQRLGCWEGGIQIPRDLYEQALNVFESAGKLVRRHPYDQVCASPDEVT